MTFHWPHAFWLLLIPLALHVRDFRRRRHTLDSHPKITHAEASHSSLVIADSSLRRGSAPRVRIFFSLALAATTVALARPQWGRLEEPVFDQAREIIIALDLSRSMLAEDVKPNRLERARLLITSLLERLKGERVGLIVFSGTAFLQSPLSSDYEILREFLPVLDPGYLPEGGTNYDDLLDASITAFGASNAADRFLIVLSDGEAQSDTWQKHLSALKTKGIRVLGLGIGTDSGAIIPDGNGAFVKDERGAVVLSKLNSSTLRELAEKTNGRYADASGWVDLSQLIEQTVDQGRRGEFKETSRVRLAERFQWPLAAALALFLLSFWRESPVRPKPRPIQLATRVALLLLLCLHSSIPSLLAAGSAGDPTSATSAPVAQIIGRLASRPQPTAGDYAELARATLTFGQRTQAARQPMPEGPVRDALAAVSAGTSLDPKAADWPRLRTDLEALLIKQDPPKDKPKPEEKKPEQNKKSADQKKSGDSGDPSQQSKDEKDKKPSDSGQPPEKPSNDGGEDKQPDSDKKSGPPDKPGQPGKSAFGEMKEHPPKPDSARSGETPQADSPPAPNPAEMQQVGGTPTETSNDPARQDPALSVPLQKLDQVKQGDSPARLFQLLQEPGKSDPAPKGKDW